MKTITKTEQQNAEAPGIDNSLVLKEQKAKLEQELMQREEQLLNLLSYIQGQPK